MKSENSTPTNDVGSKLKAFAYGDKYIWAIYILLCVVSIVEQYSASARIVSATDILGPIVKQIMHLSFGLVIILVVQRISYTKFFAIIPLIAVASVVLAVYVMFFGDVINGARRSIKLFGMLPLQPAELIKFSAAALLAVILSKSQLKDGKGVTKKGFYWALIVIGIFGAVLIKQGTTNTIILMAICFSMMIIGGVQWKRILSVVGILVVVAAITLGYGYSKYCEKYDENGKIRIEYAQKESAADKIEKGETVDRLVDVVIPRLIRWWKGDETPKWEQPIDRFNHQEQYSYIAQANGGVFGVFPGNSREAARLPLAFSDYIFAIIVEDTGLLGGMFVLLLYLSLLARASGIASQCKRAFPMMLVLGMALYIVYQALAHVGIVSGLLPVSGQPLPLISAGGSSILIISLAIGVMLSVSRHAVRKNNEDKTDDRNEMNSLPEEARAINPSKL